MVSLRDNVGRSGAAATHSLIESGKRDESRAPFALSYQPALDGVRAIAVTVVVIFHLDVGLLSGGYLGVSVFFTLSGFLITALLLGESATPSTRRVGIDLGRFYVRRIKRLVPASVATLSAIILLAAAGLVASTANLRGDITAAAWNVFNWRELTSGDSYAELFTDPSPVAHFWSLAIEEQFYLAWPLVIVVLTQVLRLGRSGLLVALCAMFALSATTAVLASPDVTYLATHTRAAEILAGAILATWMSTATTARWPRWWARLGIPALAVVILASILTPSSSGWAYSGGLVVFAWVSVALIAGLQMNGRARTLLSIAPLVALGRISYGVYLVHWPVFVVLDERRLGTDGWSLAAARLLVTAAIAIAMYLVLERPIRLSRRVTRPIVVTAVSVGAMISVTVGAVLLVSEPAPTDGAPVVLGAAQRPTDGARAVPERAPATDAPVPTAAAVEPASTRAAADRDALVGPTRSVPGSERTVAGPVRPAAGSVSPVTRTAAPEARTDPDPPSPVTVAVFGDSVPAWLLRDAAASFSRSDAVVLNGAMEACDGMVDLPLGRDRRRGEFVVPADCKDWRTSYPATLANASKADVALLVLGQAPVVDRFIDGRWQGPCDSIDWYVADLADRVEYLRTAGTRPILAIPARFGHRVTFIVPDDHLERVGCVRSALIAAAAALDVDVLDLDELLCPDDDCEAVRTLDGIHVDPDAAPGVLNAVVDRVVEDWRALDLTDMRPID
ncbi:acyltransferase family protein [Ilumatobacter nonamiensis]|uniref:acyltransferase family protein n=1 Tax=Ilumatobacter nonamiensis TaxID=467093 RepID=UPI0003471D6D|nr:acyltransferase [Ilumatobacter nonamiensis]